MTVLDEVPSAFVRDIYTNVIRRRQTTKQEQIHATRYSAAGISVAAMLLALPGDTREREESLSGLPEGAKGFRRGDQCCQTHEFARDSLSRGLTDHRSSAV